MSDLPIEKRFGILCQISRAQHFAWRQAVQEMCPDLDPEDAVNRMWEIVGKQTGDSYAKHLREDQPLPMQIASSVAWSSQCMGEEAVVEAGADEGEALMRYPSCCCPSPPKNAAGRTNRLRAATRGSPNADRSLTCR